MTPSRKPGASLGHCWDREGPMETSRVRGIKAYPPAPPSAPRNAHPGQGAGAGRVNYDALTLQTLSLSLKKMNGFIICFSDDINKCTLFTERYKKSENPSKSRYQGSLSNSQCWYQALSSVLYIHLAHFLVKTSQPLYRVGIILRPTFQMRKLRHREIK